MRVQLVVFIVAIKNIVVIVFILAAYNIVAS